MGCITAHRLAKGEKTTEEMPSRLTAVEPVHVCVEGGRGSRQGQSIQSLRLLGGSVGEKAGGSTFPAASQQ